MAKLILMAGGERQVYELAPLNTLGRHPDNSIQILDRIISKEHAQIVRGGDGSYLLRDLSSLNGTFVRGARISEHRLQHGDEVVMGSTHLRFEERPPSGHSLDRVTIAPSALESIVCHELEVGTSAGEFLPERQIGKVEQLRRDYEKLRIAHELGRAIVGLLDLEELLPRILDKAFELLPADRGVILLYEGGSLAPRYVKHRVGREEDEIILSRSILHEVEQHKKAVLSSDATMDSRFSGAHSIIMQGIRSTMCVPLIHGEELLGIMHLDSRVATNAFTDKDLQLFSGIAGQAAVAIENARLVKKIEEETKTRAQFQRLLSPNLVEQLVAGKLHLEKGGELREVTILISDIRGFTHMSEKKEPAEIVQMLNEYFELMVDILFKAEGTLDKYVGDELMALFGAPVDMPEAALHAVRCAVEMQKALREFNHTRVAEGLEPLYIGIGINTGRVITGAIGSSRTLQYTAIGDPVNTASRLCAIAKPGEIIVSESTMMAVGDATIYAPLAPVQLRGKGQEQKVFNILGMRDQQSRRIPSRPM